MNNSFASKVCIELLPNEVLRKILENLEPSNVINMLFVSQRFHTIAFDIINALVINYDSTISGDAEMLRTIQRYKSVTEQSRTNTWIQTVIFVNRMKNPFHSLKQLLPGSGLPITWTTGKLLVVNLFPQFKGLTFVHQVTKFLSELIAQVFDFCTNVEHINFTDINITDSQVKYIPERILTNLISLQVNKCERITNHAMAFICKWSTKLQYLSLDECTNISDTGILHTVKCCPEIHTIKLCGTSITKLGVCSISEYCLKIKVLLLQECKRICSEDFGDISKKFKCLEELDISSNGEFITDKAIQTLVTRCTTLTHFNISESFSVTDIALFAIADHCKMLSCLKLRRCTNVTQNGIVYVIRKCNYLRDMNISGIYNISDTSLFAIANHCKALVKLNIQDCTKVTQEGIKYLLVNCSRLKSLYLRQGQIDKLFLCNRINRTNTFHYLRAMHPNLKINKIDVDCYSIEK